MSLTLISIELAATENVFGLQNGIGDAFLFLVENSVQMT